MGNRRDAEIANHSVDLPDGYHLDIKSDMSAVVINAKGKELASVPPKVRKSDAWKQWMSLKENHRERLKDNTRVIVRWMVSREEVEGHVLAALMQDPAWREPLSGLLVDGTRKDGSTVTGLILDGDPQKGLGVFTLELDSEWMKDATWRVRHPATDTDDVAAWRTCVSDNGIEQGTPQLLRSLHVPTAAEMAARKSDRFSGRTLDSAAFISHAFNRRGWATSSGVASREFVIYRNGDAPQRVSVQFEYFAGGDYGDWNQECETGELKFVDKEGETMRVREVPLAVFSEACTDINAVIAR